MAEVAQPSTGPGAVFLLTYNEDDKNFYSVGHTPDYTKEWREKKEVEEITLVGFVQTKDMENVEKKAKEALVGGDLNLRLKGDLNKPKLGMAWYQDDAKKSSPENVLVKLARAVEDVIEWVYILTRRRSETDIILHDIMPPIRKVVYEMVLYDCINNEVCLDVFYETLKEHYASEDFQASSWVYVMKCNVMTGIACYTIGRSERHPEIRALGKIRNDEDNGEIELVIAAGGMGHGSLNAFHTALENAGFKKIQRQEGERKWYIEIEQA